MRRFFIGFLVGIVALLLAGFFYLRLGYFNPRADVPVGTLEQAIAMPSLDAAVGRSAPDVRNPVSATDANLIAGMNIYQVNCSSCHGDIHRAHGMLAEALYPRPPQFVKDAADMPENQNFYIIRHGIRLSGMPAWKQSLTDEQIWQVTTFLSHMDKLPPVVSGQWKAVAAGTTGVLPASLPAFPSLTGERTPMK